MKPVVLVTDQFVVELLWEATLTASSKYVNVNCSCHQPRFLLHSEAELILCRQSGCGLVIRLEFNSVESFENLNVYFCGSLLPVRPTGQWVFLWEELNSGQSL